MNIEINLDYKTKEVRQLSVFTDGKLYYQVYMNKDSGLYQDLSMDEHRLLIKIEPTPAESQDADNN